MAIDLSEDSQIMQSQVDSNFESEPKSAYDIFDDLNNLVSPDDTKRTKIQKKR